MTRLRGYWWIPADDNNIQKKGWPRNAEDSYMFFLIIK